MGNLYHGYVSHNQRVILNINQIRPVYSLITTHIVSQIKTYWLLSLNGTIFDDV